MDWKTGATIDVNLTYCQLLQAEMLLKPDCMNIIPTYHITHIAHVYCESLSIAFEHVSTFPFKL